MPRVTVPWDPVRGEGNPTLLEAVNRTIKRIKRFEVRHEGVESSARRAIEFEEFLPLLSRVRAASEKGATKFVVASVLTLQWQRISRIDDVMELEFSCFTSGLRHLGTLTYQLRWLKDISEEHEAPEQIVFGSLDPRICPLINLAVHTETNAASTDSEFVFGNPRDGARTVRRFLQHIFDSSGFHRLKAGHLGAHSLRKGAATYGSRSGLSKDYINRRGRWRTRNSVVDIYIDNDLPYPDATTAAVLVETLGPCFYAVRDGVTGVTEELLVDHIAPAAKHILGKGAAKVLALPLLWAALLPSGSYDNELIPVALKKRAIRAYQTRAGAEEMNPVRRVAFHVDGDGGQLQLVETSTDENGGNVSVSTGDRAASTINARQEFAALHSQIFSLKRQMADNTSELLYLRWEIQRANQTVVASDRRIALQPVVRPVSTNRHTNSGEDGAVSGYSHGENQPCMLAKLPRRSKDLFELWHEFQFGQSGCKPAKDFTSVERGASKFAFSRRKEF